jgi:glutamate---cysteine ligase / carboxylate-amine ligase
MALDSRGVRGGALSIEASVFDEAGGLTVGIEEELILLDPGTLDPAPAADSVLALLGDDERFTAELKRAQLELVTPVARSVPEAARRLAEAREALVERLDGRFRVVAVGVHPRRSGLGGITPAARFRELAERYQWLARTARGCGLHVHVAPGGAERSIAVFNAVRAYLPELAAISANSPFVDGEDTGLASVRQLGEAFPRTGVPPAFEDWADLARYLEWGRTGRLFPDPTYLWWDVRPSLAHGTIELRAADAQTRVADTAAIAALFVCLVADLARQFDRGERLPAPPAHLIAENSWSALRYGSKAELVDLSTGEPQPARDRIAALVERLAPVAARLGCAAELRHVEALAGETGADRQRTMVAVEGLDGLLRRLVAETEGSGAVPEPPTRRQPG